MEVENVEIKKAECLGLGGFPGYQTYQEKDIWTLRCQHGCKFIFTPGNILTWDGRAVRT